MDNEEQYPFLCKFLYSAFVLLILSCIMLFLRLIYFHGIQVFLIDWSQYRQIFIPDLICVMTGPGIFLAHGNSGEQNVLIMSIVPVVVYLFLVLSKFWSSKFIITFTCCWLILPIVLALFIPLK